MKEFTQIDARNAIMDITSKAHKSYDLAHAGETLDQSYLDARRAYINTVIFETLPPELLKMAI